MNAWVYAAVLTCWGLYRISQRWPVATATTVGLAVMAPIALLILALPIIFVVVVLRLLGVHV